MSNLIANYIATLPDYKRKLLNTQQGRIVVCKTDFRLFSYIYFRNVLKSSDTHNEITLSEFHDAFINDAIKYMKPSTIPASSRTAWVCPRGSGKSSWEMILIIWLGAYYPEAFIALFSATSTQSEQMLSNIRAQFNSNHMLRDDFPDLVRPATKTNEAIKLSDNKQLIMQQNGFICTGRGVNTSVLGMRLAGNRRPTHIFGDDLEAGESQTTQTDVAKLLVTVQDDIMPLSLNAHFVWVGTTTRPRGLTEALVHYDLGMDYPTWVEDENFKVHYYPALKTNDQGEKYSIWEERWSTEYLLSQEHTRSFKKNYQCLPAAEDYAYWTPEVFQYENPPELDYAMLSVDPAVTISERSDYTGLAVIGFNKETKRIYVLHAEQVKLSGADLRNRAKALLEMYPIITLIYAEANQGGNLISDLFKPLPVKVKTVNQSVKKEIRAATALAEYEKGNVFHTHRLVDAENQMIAFPQKGVHDDIVDAIGTGVIYFTKAQNGSRVKVSQGSYAR